MSVTLAAFTMASAASTAPTNPLVSIIPKAIWLMEPPFLILMYRLLRHLADARYSLA
jgi:hypothetical protein